MFYLIDKPLHLSSFDVLRKLRKVLGIKKMGHFGTLDPLASGLLLVATEKSTKLIHLLEGLRKRYRFTVRFDGISDSFDCGTPIYERDTSGYTERSDEVLVSYLEGLKEQTPPRYSALHIDGKRAYERARSGESFEMTPRPIQISGVVIESQNPGVSITLSIDISSGGYIRSLAPVIAGFYGLEGSGYISDLRRTHIYISEETILDTQISSSIEIPHPISYNQIFPTIHTIDISELIYRELLNGKLIHMSQLGEVYTTGKYFLRYGSDFLSLCEYDGLYFKILRNDI